MKNWQYFGLMTALAGLVSNTAPKGSLSGLIWSGVCAVCAVAFLVSSWRANELL